MTSRARTAAEARIDEMCNEVFAEAKVKYAAPESSPAPTPHPCARCGDVIRWALALCFTCGRMRRAGQLQRAAQQAAKAVPGTLDATQTEDA